jgi:hypothetical protein
LPPFGPATVQSDETGGFSLVDRDAASGVTRRLAEGRAAVDDTTYRVRVLRVVVRVGPALDVPALRGLLALPGWIDEQAARMGAAGIEVTAADPALRQILRDVGYGGPLRAPLCKAPAGPVRPELAAGEDRGDAAHKSAALARFVGDLVPGAVVTAGSGGGLSRAARWLAALSVGQLRLLELQVSPRTPQIRSPLRLRVPDRADLLVEQVALAVDVAAGVLARFPWLKVLALAFDQGDFGFRSGRLGGYARPQAQSDLHVNAAYVMGDLPGARGRYGANPGFHPPTERSPVEDVVVHELWHAVEHDFEVRHFRESIELRRELGGYFGVDTLERVFDPGHEPARTRLGYEVSGYATENRREATAELFTEWWHNPRPRPAAAAFGRLIDNYLRS